MKDARGHGSEARGGAVSLQEAQKPGVRSSARGTPLPQDNLDTMKTIADLRARMSGTGPGHQATLGQGVRNLGGAVFDRPIKVR